MNEVGALGLDIWAIARAYLHACMGAIPRIVENGHAAQVKSGRAPVCATINRIMARESAGDPLPSSAQRGKTRGCNVMMWWACMPLVFI